jgi:hypothetical protein
VLTGVAVWLSPRVVVVLAVAGVRIGGYDFRYDTCEHRRSDRHLIAYAAALGAGRWSVPVGAAPVSARTAVPDRLLGIGVLESSDAQPGDRDVQFRPAADIEGTVATVERPATDTHRQQRAPAVVGAASRLARSRRAVPVGLAFSPQMDTAQHIGLAVALGPGS